MAEADIVHEERTGLWRAILRYNPTYGTTLSIYAWPAIARHVSDAVAYAHR